MCVHLFFVFFYTSCSHLQCHATRHSIHLTVLFFFLPSEAPRRVTCTFFFHRHCLADLCSGNRLGVCGFGRASAVTRACRGLTWWVAFLTPTALASFFLFSAPFGRDAAERPRRSPALPPGPSLKKKKKRGLVEYWCHDGYVWQSYRV